ncbi:MAG: insulinase family protein [Bacteroidota bacterium]|nr:insulinase family protein [Bacteroidota bacterium]
MKYIYLGISILFATLGKGQQGTELIKYQLKNGLTVMLNPDPKATTVFGAVIVKAGSKYDPKNATGMAHYLEHMCFKGTETVGSTNYDLEKPILDSIVLFYDSLGLTKDAKKRKEIQTRINAASNRAAKYAIPNELDRMLQSIGSNGVNAFTSDEMVVYLNSFPAFQLNKWLLLYSERFNKPVFRLFQSELEVVYEEKNRLSDNFIFNIITKFNANLYKNHPYGTQPTIGTTEHLKNPSLRKMQEYYDTYFVANNMAILLTGNFDVNEAKKYITEYYEKWPTGTVPTFPKYTEEEFKGQERVKLRSSPVKIGILGYRTVPIANEDNLTIEVISKLLNNSTQSGFLDNLRNDNQVLFANNSIAPLGDFGSMIIVYVPKILGQSLENANKLIQLSLDSIRNYRVDESKLNAAKNSLIFDYYKQMEDQKNRALHLVNSFIHNQSWDSMLEYPKLISKISPENVQFIAKKYFGDNYLNIESRMGFAKKDKINKPDYIPIVIKKDDKSRFATEFEKIKSLGPKTDFVTYGKDYDTIPFGGGQQLYRVNNTINDVFELKIIYKLSSLDVPAINESVQYINMLGPNGVSFKDFKKQLNQLGLNLDFEYDKEQGMIISLSGFENRLDTGINILNNFILNLVDDPSSFKTLLNDVKSENKVIKNDVTSQGLAISSYLRFGTKSEMLNRISYDDLKKLGSDTLLRAFRAVLLYPHTVHYSGSTQTAKLSKYMSNAYFLNTKPSKSPMDLGNLSKKYEKPIAFVFENKKARQSQIYYYAYDGTFDKTNTINRVLFNSYFGGGMSGIVFQEIREFRSLAYASRYIFSDVDKPYEYQMGYIGCQGDKTLETIKVMDSLLNNLVYKPERWNNIKEGKVNEWYSSKPEWRNVTENVAEWKELGYNGQPQEYLLSQISNVSYTSMMSYAKSKLIRQNRSIAILGNAKNIPYEYLNKNYTVVKIKFKDIYKE